MQTDANNNKIYGDPKLIDSNIQFIGKNNILYFEKNDIRIENSCIVFKGDNSVVVIRRTCNPIRIALIVYNESAVYIGRDVWLTGRFEMNAGEAKNIIIGDECLISSQCSARTTDSHMIFSIETLQRINEGKSIFIGDHVWISARVALLKGAKIHSGSIIGADAVIANKEILSNSIWGGNPARLIKSNCFFDKTGTHQLTNSELLSYSMYEKDMSTRYIFKNDSTYLSFEDLDQQLISSESSEERLNILLAILKYSKKNRFAKL